ncbi:MAG: DUF72 domain-containing protein [Bryobacterales bacterium]|nr:DUF72 domain-containing protein [Bryobacterales bacterium]
MLPLFDDPPPHLASLLAPRLRLLAAEHIYFGTSSWKYEGWMGQIYTRERYLTRGKFSRKKFEAECLEEYSKTFPVVCGDFSFYQFPSVAYWQRLFASAPRLLFAFKVPEDITVKRFPTHARYGPRAGLYNETFLDAGVFQDAFLRPLEPYRDRIGALIFEFGAFSRSAFEGEAPFLDQLDAFLRALPKGFRYSVEVRNPEFLGPEYFGCLRAHGVAHVFNSWTRMPELGRQMTLEEAYTADFQVVRALLRPGRTYEEAVARFSPYLHVQEPLPAERMAARQFVDRARSRKQLAFLFVNNRLEGNAPESIAAMIED